jgi:hypothetical protein
MAMACEKMSTGRRPYTLLMGAQTKLPKPAAAIEIVPTQKLNKLHVGEMHRHTNVGCLDGSDVQR